MWQKPNRPNHDISQPFSDGFVEIYQLEDTAKPGYMPKEEYVMIFKLRYAEQRLGVSRYYAAMQNQIQIQRVIRVPRIKGITNQHIAVTEDGQQYRIDLIQTADTYPPSLDLTLVQYSQGISEEEEDGSDLV